MHRIILPAAVKRNGQTARRVHVTEEKFGQSRAAFLSWIPGLDKRRDMIKPGIHVHVSAGRDHNNGVLVGRGHLLYQLVLSGRQTKSSVRAFALSLWIESRGDYHDIGFRGELLCFLTNQASVTCDTELHACSKPT